jgi:hypothetical protein
MRFALTFLLALLIFHVPARAAAPDTHAELLARVQAADVLSDLLTWHGSRLAERVDTMANYLKEVGNLDAYNAAPTPATQPSNNLFYGELFNGAVKFVKSGGDQYADPALKNLDDSQLLQEFSALQEYDIEQFVFLNQKHQSVASVTAYLNSINAFPDYLKWAQTHAPQVLPTAGATRPSNLTPEQTIACSEQLMASARAAALQRALAKGMSEADFNQQWNQKQAQFKADITERVQGMTALSAAYDQTPPPAPEPANPNPPPAPPNNYWNTWHDPYNDAVIENYQGPGLYGSYDTRVNDEYDRRIEGEYDRRRALGFDRRENVRYEVRRGF